METVTWRMKEVFYVLGVGGRNIECAQTLGAFQEYIVNINSCWTQWLLCSNTGLFPYKNEGCSDLAGRLKIQTGGAWKSSQQHSYDRFPTHFNSTQLHPKEPYLLESLSHRVSVIQPNFNTCTIVTNTLATRSCLCLFSVWSQLRVVYPRHCVVSYWSKARTMTEGQFCYSDP